MVHLYSYLLVPDLASGPDLENIGYLQKKPQCDIMMDLHPLVVYWIVHENVEIRNAHFGVLLQQTRFQTPPLNRR